jgi:Flp pilus assembly protein TadD
LRELYGKLKDFEKRLRQLYSDRSAEITRLYDALAGGEMADVYDYENAIAVAKRYDLRLLPNIAIACRVDAFLYREALSEEETKRAESALRALTMESGFETPAWNGLGYLLSWHSKRYEEAERAYRRAIELAPRSAHPWHNLGWLLQTRLKRQEEAEQAYRHAIELDSQFASAWNGLGVLLLDDLERYEEAEPALRRAIELDSQSVYPWSNLGRLLMERASHREAAETLLRAFEIDSTRSGDLDHFVQAGHRLADSPDELPALLKMVQHAHEIVPDNLEIQFLLARVLTLAEQWPEASQLLEQLASNESAFFSEGFFRSAIQTGHLDDVSAILQRTGANERWRPLYEALQSARAGTPDYLRTVAPEVRMAATKILRRLAPDLFDTEEPVLDKS